MSNGTKKPDSQWTLCEKLIACCRVAELLLSENVHLTTQRPPKHGTTEGDDWLAHLARERFLFLLLLLIDERRRKTRKDRLIKFHRGRVFRSLLNHFYWILSSSVFYWLRRCFISVIYDFIGRCY